MDSYQEYLRGRTPEEWAKLESQAQAYRAQIQPVIDRAKAGEITKQEALDRLTEIKGGGPQARASAAQLLMRALNREKWEAESEEGNFVD